MQTRLMQTRLFFFLLCALLLLAAPHPAPAQDNGGAAAAAAQSYTTISAVSVTPLSNGVQIRIAADGILQFRTEGGDYGGGSLYGARMTLSFPGAKNGTGKNFFNVSSYPVSYLQVATSKQAVGGIGVDLTISNFVSTNASVTTEPDGQGVLITVQSDRTVERGRRAGSAAPLAALKPDTSTLVRFENGRLSVRAVKADIHTFLSAIAGETGLSVAVDDAVDRKISLNIQNADPDSVVRSIATAYGLALSKIDGIYMISEGVPTDLATYHLSGTQSYRMQNTQALTASGLLPNFLFSYVKVNSEQNAVVVTAPSQMLAKISSDLNRVDIPSPQILIEVIAVELTNTTDKSLGITVNNTAHTSITTVDVPNGLITYNTIGALPKNFLLTLQALEQTGKARVRARPQMAVVNGRTAEIFIGAQRFILTQFNGYGQTQTRIQPVDVGVKLSITPLTGGNGEITTRVAPEVSNITELDLQTGLPVLSTRRADTTVRVKDGETIAIGGLTLNQEQTVNSKIPLFGDIPLIGNLFRSKKKNLVQTELVVFVTPRIIRNGVDTLPVAVPAGPRAVTPPVTRGR